MMAIAYVPATKSKKFMKEKIKYRHAHIYTKRNNSYLLSKLQLLFTSKV